MDKPCFELKGSLFTLSVLQLFGNDLSRLEEQLKERIQMAPAFFNHTPFVIDLHEFKDDSHTLDFSALKELLLSLSIVPVGVKGADKSLHEILESAGLSILAEAKTTHTKTPEPATEDSDTADNSDHQITPEVNLKENAEPNQATEAEVSSALEAKQEQVVNEADAPKVASTPAKNKCTKIIKRTIRSGQQAYAPDGDLVIIGSVSAGAEILATGNIHVYGTLRGRALAGIQGDQSATIFCHCLQAELYSIAGIYLLSDDLPQDKIGQSVHIYLEDEKIQIESI